MPTNDAAHLQWNQICVTSISLTGAVMQETCKAREASTIMLT